MIFKDKTVIITGGSDGVGAAAARMFAEAGANLVLVARGKRNLEAIAEELRHKTQVETFPMDVADADACAAVFRKAEYEFGRIDILVNNAGFHQRGRFETVSAEDHATMVDVNLRAPITLTRLALPHLRDAEGGAIINVGSLAGWQPLADQVSYSATKAGLRTFTYALFEELRGSNIKIALVSPGPIDTGFIMDNLDTVADLTMSQPISTAEEVAQAIVELCGNRRVEAAMPAFSALLSRFFKVLPWLKRLLLPVFEARGARVKRRLRAKRASGDSQ